MAKNIKGFSLVELMVTITILSILSVGSFLAVTNSQNQGKDARRKADLEVIRGGLQLYYADHHAYPAASDFQPACNTTWLNYIPKMPCDPVSSEKYGYDLETGSNNQRYFVGAKLNTTPATVTCTQALVCDRTTTPNVACNYCLSNP